MQYVGARLASMVCLGAKSLHVFSPLECHLISIFQYESKWRCRGRKWSSSHGSIGERSSVHSRRVSYTRSEVMYISLEGAKIHWWYMHVFHKTSKLLIDWVTSFCICFPYKLNHENLTLAFMLSVCLGIPIAIVFSSMNISLDFHVISCIYQYISFV